MGKPNWMKDKDNEQEEEKKPAAGRPNWKGKSKAKEAKKEKESQEDKERDARPNWRKADADTEKEEKEEKRFGSRFAPPPKATEEKEGFKPAISKTPTGKKGEAFTPAMAAPPTAKKPETTEPEEEAEEESGLPTVHTVVAGDNLSYISKQYYGTTDHWNKIWQANKDIIKDPNVVRAGQELTIPKLD